MEERAHLIVMHELQQLQCGVISTDQQMLAIVEVQAVDGDRSGAPSELGAEPVVEADPADGGGTRQVIVRPVVDAGAGQSLAILRCVGADDGTSMRHRLHQGGMDAPHHRGMDVTARMRLQLVVAAAVDPAGEYRARVGGRQHPADVRRGIRCLAGDHQLERQVLALVEGGGHGVGVVLGLQPADVEHVASGPQREARDRTVR